MKKVALHNLGCKVNAYEMDAMQQLLVEAGYEIVPWKERADIYLINTCTVTNTADRKSRQMLNRARKQNPDAVIVAAGCYVQAQEEAGQAPDYADIVIGNNRKKDLIRILQEYEENQRNADIIDINHTKEYEKLQISHTSGHTRAYIKVQDGCNQFCSYCIIPYTRGRVRSRALSDVISEVRELAANGYREIVLTGIHLSSYGVDLEEGSLLSLIHAVSQVEGIDRIRLGSLEPRIITEEFAKALSENKKICPHFHLSLQSGCNTTLVRMNRKYTAEEYYEKCCLLRKYFKNPALTTDVIVGFPGETEEEFEETRAFIDQVSFYETHVFQYSRRRGTRADAMPDQIPESVKKQRSEILLALDEKKRRLYEESWLQQKVEVLMEEAVERDGVIYQTGHTKEYVRVQLKSKENMHNRIISMQIADGSQIVH